MAKPTTSLNNLTITGGLTRDPFLTQYRKKSGEDGYVCNFTVEIPIRGCKFPPRFHFVTFDPALAVAIASNYRKDQVITVARSRPFPCKDKQKDGSYKDILKWMVYAIEAMVPDGEYDDSHVATGSGDGGYDDIPF